MKQFFLSCALLFPGASVSFAQIKTPAASPSGKVMQDIGLTSVTVEYSRPSMKGRTIFGKDGLVPTGEVWRTGANQATKISFDQPVSVGGKELQRGDYAILSKPGMDTWEIMFFPYEGGNWGSYVEKTPAATVTTGAKRMNGMTETFTIGFDNLKNTSGDLYFSWANMYVPLTIETETDEMAMASIDRALAGPSARDYYLAASYYHDNGKDLEKAYEYARKSNDMDAKFWQLRREALILADLGRTKEAIQTAQRSMQLAQEAGNQDYVRMNEKSIKEWSMGGKTGEVDSPRTRVAPRTQKAVRQ